MARPLRLEYPYALYHITSRGDRRENIYEDDADREQYLDVLSSVINQFNWVCFAYCLMDNHYHLLVQTPDGNLSKGMRQLNGVYTQSYNRRHKKTGHLFQGRYKAILCQEEAYLLELSRYIVLNPVKARIVKRAENWKWSSYQATTGRSLVPEWLSVEYLLSQFSRQKKAAIRKYEAFVEEGLKNGPIWDQLKNQVYLGDAKFIEKALSHLDEQQQDVQIPKSQKRPIPQALEYYERHTLNRNDAIINAYLSGGYSYEELGRYFSLHFTTVGKIIRGRQKSKS